jgi:hypothetical protein
VIPSLLKTFLKIAVTVCTLFFICACSIYKSSGRKSFESSAKQNISLQYLTPLQCDDISSVSYWYETRFSSPHSQWIESLPHFEVWLDTLEGQKIQIRTYEKHDDQPHELASITRCQSTFDSYQEWQQYRSFYLKSLEGEQL